jgi:hypothetical protein
MTTEKELELELKRRLAEAQYQGYIISYQPEEDQWDWTEVGAGILLAVAGYILIIFFMVL